MGDGLNKVRYLLINTGKALPFIICAVVLVSYTENVYALLTRDYLCYDGSMVLNKPISWAIGGMFEYNIQHLSVLTILAVAIRTCIWNKLTIVYLFANLAEKELFMAVELYEEYIYAIVGANMIVSALLVYKGIRLVTSR